MRRPYDRRHSDAGYAAGVRGIGQYMIDYPMSVGNVRVETDESMGVAKITVDFIAPLTQYDAAQSKQKSPQQLTGQPMLTGQDDGIIDGEIC